MMKTYLLVKWSITDENLFGGERNWLQFLSKIFSLFCRICDTYILVHRVGLRTLLVSGDFRKASPALLINIIRLLATADAVSLFWSYVLRRCTVVVDGRACSWSCIISLYVILYGMRKRAGSAFIIIFNILRVRSCFTWRTRWRIYVNGSCCLAVKYLLAAVYGC